MKKLVSLVVLVSLCAIGIAFTPKSDHWIRERVVQLEGNGVLCTGEQVRAPSGVDYILSAGHCMKMNENGSVNVFTEGGQKLLRRIIAEDPSSDLMLIEGLPDLEGFSVAGGVYLHESVRAVTHGGGKPTYETRGELLGVSLLQIPVKQIADESECVGSKYTVMRIEALGITACVLSVEETIASAQIIPGSSGGPVINSDAELVGVASATDGQFGSLVRLSDIRQFLSGY